MARLSNNHIVRKPVGWKNESYRHYLSAKGVSTKRFVNKNSKGRHDYYAADYRKGNRNTDQYDSMRKSLQAQGYNAELQNKLFQIPKKPKKKNTLLDVPDRDEIAVDLTATDSAIPSSSVASLPRASIDTEGSFEQDFNASQPPVVEEQPTELPTQVERPIEDKTVSELSAKEKRQLMDQLQTKGIPEPPPSFSTPGVAEMPPSTPFSQSGPVETPAQAPFTSGSGMTTVTRPLRVKKKEEPKAMDFVNDMGKAAPALFARKEPLGDRDE